MEALESYGWQATKRCPPKLNEAVSTPRDPFGRTTDKVQMNPGYQASGLVKPAGPVELKGEGGAKPAEKMPAK